MDPDATQVLEWRQAGKATLATTGADMEPAATQAIPIAHPAEAPPGEQPVPAPTKKRKGYRPGRNSLIVTIVALILITALARALTVTYASDHPITYLRVARSAGFAIYVLLTVAVAQGIFLSLRWRMGSATRLWMERLHAWLLIAAGLVLTVHVGMLLRVNFPVLYALVPYTSDFRRVSVGAGVISMYIGAVLTLSTYRMRLIGGYRVWRIVHYLGFIAWIQALIHGLMTGFDSQSTWAMAIYLSGAVVVGALVLLRIARGIYLGRRPSPAAQAA